MLAEAVGIPVGLAIDGANRIDFKMLEETIQSIPIRRPKPTSNDPQNLCLDKGYDYTEVYDLLKEFRLPALRHGREETALDGRAYEQGHLGSKAYSLSSSDHKP